MTTPVNMVNTLDGPIASLRERSIQLIEDIAEALGQNTEETQEDVRRLRAVVQDLRDMFFLVAVVGEFNAGKSTFVNAMVGERLLPMGITPTTEYIELVKYSKTPERQYIMQDDSTRVWGHPNTGAPGVAIVDTPGTGSIFDRHEETAKDFLHRSDLVIFLISGKHAFAETERTYMELAKRFGKKIILVVNQMDLLEPKDRDEVRRFISNNVKKTLDLEPLIFMISAKQALEAAENNGPADAGGLDAVKAHLRGVYAEAPPTKQKLIGQLDTAETILRGHKRDYQTKIDLVSADIGKVQDVQKELEAQSLGLETRMKEAGAEIDRVLEGIRKRGINFIETHLTIRRLGRGVDRNKLQEEFEEDVIGRSLREINDAAGDYISAVVDQSRLYWRSVIDRLNRLQDLMEQEASGVDSGIYAEQRQSLQDAIRIAETELRSYSSGEVIKDMKSTFDSNMGNFQASVLASVSGVIIAVAAVLVQGPLMGAAAAPLVLPAFVIGSTLAVVAGVPAVMYVRRINNETKDKFNERIDMLIKNYDEALDELTRKERNRLTQYGNQILTPIFSRLEVLSRRYEEQQKKIDRHLGDIDDLRERIKAL